MCWIYKPDIWTINSTVSNTWHVDLGLHLRCCFYYLQDFVNVIWNWRSNLYNKKTCFIKVLYNLEVVACIISTFVSGYIFFFEATPVYTATPVITPNVDVLLRNSWAKHANVLILVYTDQNIFVCGHFSLPTEFHLSITYAYHRKYLNIVSVRKLV